MTVWLIIFTKHLKERRIILKRIISLVIVAMLVLSLAAVAGCKSSGSGDNAGSAKTSNKILKGVADGDAETLETLTKTGEVSAYFYTDPDEDFVSQFEELYGGKLDARIITMAGWEQTFLADFAAQDAPNLVHVTNVLWPKAGNRGLVYTYKEMKDKGAKLLDHPLIADEYDTVAANFSYKGDVYGFANYSTPISFFCVVNEDLYGQYGVKSPSEYYKEGKWNYDALRTSSLDLMKAAGNDDSGVAKVHGYYCWDYTTMVRGNGRQIVNIDAKTGDITLNFDDVGVVNALEHIKDAYNINKWGTINSDDWAKGTCGVYVSNNIKTPFENISFKTSVLPYPTGADNTSGTLPGIITAWAITTGTENIQGCINFVIAYKYFYNTKEQTAEEKAFNPDEVFKDDPELIKSYKDWAARSVNENFPGIGSLNDKQWSFWSDIRNSSKTVTETMNTFRSMFQAEIDAEKSSAQK